MKKTKILQMKILNFETDVIDKENQIGYLKYRLK